VLALLACVALDAKPIDITPATLPDGIVGLSYSQTLKAGGCSGPCMWSASGTVPPGLSLDPASGVISGTPSTAGSFQFTATATDSKLQTGSQTYTVRINSALTITTSSPLPDGKLGSSYSQTLAASGGTSPYQWSVSPGTLPPGLSLNSTNGTISGTPTSAKTFTFTIKVADRAGATATKDFSLTIAASAPALGITTNSLPGGTVGSPYSQSITASGGTPPYTWAVSSGSLPPGLSLNSSTAVIGGTPSSPNTFNFTAQVTDAAGVTANKAFTITIAPNVPKLTITTTSLPNGTAGSSYSQSITASGGTAPYSWAFTAGSLPSGLSLNASNGAIAGTPSSANTYNFTVQVTDAAGATASNPFTLTIIPATPKLTITTTSLPNGTVGSSYSQSITASGGTAPYSWAVTSGSLPPGLSLNASNGLIAGTPSAADTYNFTVQAKDASSATATQTFTVTIAPNTPKLSITTTSLPNGTVGESYSQSISASGGTPPYTWSLATGSLPPGLSLNASNGSIAGTPSSADTFNLTIQVKDATSATATQAFTVTITPATPKLTITTTSLPNGTVGTSYSQSISASGGTPPYAWSLATGSLPPGLSLNASNGSIAGTPSSADTFNFTVQVKDAGSATATQAFTVTIAPNTPKLTITTNSLLPNGTPGSNYSQTLTASGGTPPYSWSITSGSLPDGLKLDSGTGTISGTPGTAGTYPFTGRVTDSLSAVADQPLQITIGSAPPGPTLNFSSLSNSAVSAHQIPFDLNLSSAAPQPYSGQVTLSFQPDATVSRDDPAIQFSTGSRTASFTIPAGATKAVFPASTMAFQTGTVAGTITVAVSSNVPGGSLSQTVVVARAAPVIQSATVTSNNSGFQLQLTGFSNTRDLTTANFHFTAAGGQIVQTSDLSVNLAALASQWYTGSASTQFGGQFLLIVPFSVSQGTPTGLASVAVQLGNGQSTSSTATAGF